MKVQVSTITSGYIPVDLVNANFAALQAAVENTLSRDGTSPNTMNAALDMNGFPILNQGATSAPAFLYLGNWTQNTAYAINNTVYVPVGLGTSYDGCSLICRKAHTSNILNTDLGAGDWGFIAVRGLTGAGSGDMIGSNNLSELSNVSTARNTLGVQQNLFTTRGDIQVAGVAGAPARLALGASGVPLISNGTDIVYSATLGPITATTLGTNSINMQGSGTDIWWSNGGYITSLVVTTGNAMQIVFTDHYVSFNNYNSVPHLTISDTGNIVTDGTILLTGLISGLKRPLFVDTDGTITV